MEKVLQLHCVTQINCSYFYMLFFKKTTEVTEIEQQTDISNWAKLATVRYATD